ncbi:hypothetical protein BK665_06320 [Pseudomonas frederiksbergensis]|uniref:Uncharacterized protein n=1 Tax=Pseudomonas frederiksbergensis TaxID=104087 RepID=A0A423KPJ0_9PSED|nr:hypothetical protein BK665_06320 [Pseudomonas frederiksbergensis]
MSRARRIGRAAEVKRFYIGSTGSKENVVRTVQNIGRGQRGHRGRKSRRHAIGNEGLGVNVTIATDVISMQTDLPRADGDAD